MKRFNFKSHTGWYDSEYHTITKIYADIPEDAADAIAKAENWDGCHWDAPQVIFVESIEGTCMSDDAATMIRLLNAEEICEEEEDDEDEDECCEA